MTKRNSLTLLRHLVRLFSEYDIREIEKTFHSQANRCVRERSQHRTAVFPYETHS